MTAVNVTAVRVLNNPAGFNDPLAFEIEYDCIYPLQNDLEWKLIYVGSAESSKYDQTLDTVLVGPVVAGSYKFVFEANAPKVAEIPPDDIVGVTAILLTCSYNQKEFIRIGYYVNNEYVEEELRENPPERPILEKLCRSILADHPRVTRFPLDFDDNNQNMQVDDAPMGDAAIQNAQAELQPHIPFIPAAAPQL